MIVNNFIAVLYQSKNIFILFFCCFSFWKSFYKQGMYLIV